eukprot:TRINITY_DN12223_c0_g1_i4.p2 TRINITY_DN12223_c0_g1~~TRINITY_DN12223_c0_g1_i4.p2  ORF type:complete len:232 (-),score=59.52 TRINITY_DN12223_c0_g1_i4:1057-1752(-)
MTYRRTNTQQGISESPSVTSKYFSRNVKLSEPVKDHKGNILSEEAKQFPSKAYSQPLRIHRRHDITQKSYDSNAANIKSTGEKNKLIAKMNMEKQLLELEVQRLRRENLVNREPDKKLHMRNHSSQPALDINGIRSKILFFSKDNQGSCSSLKELSSAFKSIEINKKLSSTLKLVSKIKRNIKDVQVDLKDLERASRRPRNKAMFKTELSTLKKRIERLVKLVARQNSHLL